MWIYSGMEGWQSRGSVCNPQFSAPIPTTVLILLLSSFNQWHPAMGASHPKPRLLCPPCLGVTGIQGGQTVTSQCQAALGYCNAPVTGNWDPHRKIPEQLKQRAGRCVEALWLRRDWHSVCDKGQENEKAEHFWVIV